MIVIIRCNDIISDSRTKKYIDFLQAKGAEYRIIAWDRLGQAQHLPGAVYCPVRSKYNQGGVGAIKDRLRWMWFILQTLFGMKDNLRIHACDLDAAFPAAVYKLLSRRKNFLLFDVFDWISDTLYDQGRIVAMAFAFMERVSTRMADHIIICEPERVKQIPYSIEGRYSVLQNIPSFASADFLYRDDSFRFGNGLLTLVYVGGFTADRCLDMLIDGALQGLYNLNIAGYGNKDILAKLEAHAKNEHIRYYGKVAYTDGLRIMSNSDIVYAMYSKKNPNHLYAAPNKYYEAMFVGRPLITTQGIIVAEKAEANGFGYAIDETLSSLADLVARLTPDDVQQKAAQAAALWPQYSHATERYLMGTYSRMMLQQGADSATGK